MEHKDFIQAYQNHKIKPSVDLNKGHALMKSIHAPMNWRIAMKLYTWIALLAIPTAIVLFFFVTWWIPVIILLTTPLLIKAIREEGAKGVIKKSVENETFYHHAILSGTLSLIEVRFQQQISPTELAQHIYKFYQIKKKSSLDNDKLIAQEILMNRYKDNLKLYPLAIENNDFIEDLQTLAYCILNMEFENGRNQDKLAEMYLKVLQELKKLNYSPAVDELKNINILMNNAKNKGHDENEALKNSIKMGMMHRRNDFHEIIKSL